MESISAIHQYPTIWPYPLVTSFVFSNKKAKSSNATNKIISSVMISCQEWTLFLYGFQVSLNMMIMIEKVVNTNSCIHPEVPPKTIISISRALLARNSTCSQRLHLLSLIPSVSVPTLSPHPLWFSMRVWLMQEKTITQADTTMRITRQMRVTMLEYVSVGFLLVRSVRFRTHANPTSR